MSPTTLRDALATIGWSQRQLGDLTGWDDRTVRRWLTGTNAVPADIAEWLSRLADAHSALPVPYCGKRGRGRPASA